MIAESLHNSEIVIEKMLGGEKSWDALCIPAEFNPLQCWFDCFSSFVFWLLEPSTSSSCDKFWDRLFVLLIHWDNLQFNWLLSHPVESVWMYFLFEMATQKSETFCMWNVLLLLNKDDSQWQNEEDFSTRISDLESKALQTYRFSSVPNPFPHCLVIYLFFRTPLSLPSIW